MAGFTDLKLGITVNPGVISGGTRTNVVPAQARIEVDIRAVRTKDAAALEKKFRGLRPIDRRCKLHVEGGLNRPPMERSKSILSLFAAAKRIAAGLGVSVEETLSGGGSDGNFTAALGVPTLDGFGAVGEGAHSAHEHVLIKTMPQRAALLGAILATS